MRQPIGNTTYQASFPVQLMTAGVSACFADFLTFPLDTAKVRLQVRGNYITIFLDTCVTAWEILEQSLQIYLWTFAASK